MEFDLCPRSHAREVRTAIGSALCTACVKQVERNLRALPSLHQESLYHMSSHRRISNPTKVSGSRKRDHLNVSVLDARHNIAAVLGSWAQIVVEERAVPAPARSVPQLVRFLTHHLDWLTAQPPAADFADEMESLRTELLGVIDPAHAGHRPPSAACVVDYCTGNIIASPQTSGSAKKVSIRCSSGHSWEMREWLALRKLMKRKREEEA
ncbi:hypothetical protein ACFFKE_10630 [Streptomyces mutabilis]|uniref:hypothetical protein n=1 Tax=Streptomyces mutabilis TaxID=67332 RepID=UPI0017821AF5|nr:hypothetical protein [Streptomyces mutabilis]GGQ49430.1 hypothetical protein GCM10010279_68570 [Streptomyces mutabilis]